MPSTDILQFVERFITAFCGFFISVAVSFWNLLVDPRNAPQRLNKQLSDPELQQVGALTLTFCMFATIALLFFVFMDKSPMFDGSDWSLAHYLVKTAEGNLDWILITVIVFAIVSTGCMDFVARVVRHLRPWATLSKSELENRERRGETRFALVVPTFVATPSFAVLAWLGVTTINSWGYSMWPLPLAVVVALALIFGSIFLLRWQLNIKAGPPHRYRWIYLLFPAGFVGSVALGMVAALVVAHGVRSEELADVDDIHIMSPVCSLGPPGKPHLTLVVLNAGKAAAAISSGAYVSITFPERIKQIHFSAKTADSDKQQGGIIVVKAGDAVALDFIAVDDGQHLEQYAGTATGCFVGWRRYGDHNYHFAVAEIAGGQFGALSPR